MPSFKVVDYKKKRPGVKDHRTMLRYQKYIKFIGEECGSFTRLREFRVHAINPIYPPCKPSKRSIP